METLSAFGCFAGLGLLVGILFFGRLMIKKGLGAKGGGCYTRDGFYQDF